MPAGDMFEGEEDELFKGLPSVFGIAYDILIAGLNDLNRDYDVTLDKVLRICRQPNLKLNKDKYHFRCDMVPFLRKSYCNTV